MGRSRGLLFLLALLALSACTLLLSKEPLPCTPTGGCEKYSGTVCVDGECRAGTRATIDGGSSGELTDAPVGEASPATCLSSNKPLVELKGNIEQSIALGCENDYVLVGRVVVQPSVTLSIAAGTTVYGTAGTDALVIRTGAKIIAVGTVDRPIVFTKRGSADWGGVVLLGEAPVNLPDGKGRRFELEFGGVKTGDSSGRLELVRIEYATSSLELHGVGDGTTIDRVMLRFPSADCITVVGGTVNLRHVLCQHPFDDGITWDNGCTGKVQFIVVQARPKVDNDSNGLEGRSGTALPISNPTIYNGTFCGQNALPTALRTNQQYGVRAESSSEFTIANSIFMGWEALLDIRAEATDAGFDPNVRFTSSLSFGNVVANVGYVELVGPPGAATDPNFDDDNGFDETSWWRSASNKNSEDNPRISKCFDPKAPLFGPPAAIGTTPGAVGSPSAVAPPNDGFFDPNAKYLGAFKDETDNWASGKWVLWDDH